MTSSVLQWLAHQIFTASNGECPRLAMLLAAVMETDAVKPFLPKLDKESSKEAEAITAVLKQVNTMLGAFHSINNKKWKGGTRPKEVQHSLDLMLTMLLPPDADEKQMLRTLEKLFPALKRAFITTACKRNKELVSGAINTPSEIVKALKEERERQERKDKASRVFMRDYWHSKCRFDTSSTDRLKRKRDEKTGKYIQHWRRIQFCTDEQVC